MLTQAASCTRMQHQVKNLENIFLFKGATIYKVKTSNIDRRWRSGKCTLSTADGRGKKANSIQKHTTLKSMRT